MREHPKRRFVSCSAVGHTCRERNLLERHESTGAGAIEEYQSGQNSVLPGIIITQNGHVMSTAELEAIIEKLAERLKNLERTINRVEGQIADLYSRVRR